MKHLLILLALVAAAFAQDKPSARIDVKTGEAVELLAAERVYSTTDPAGFLVVDPAPVDMVKPEPIVVDGMFQGWRSQERGPTLAVIGFPTEADRTAPIVVANGEPGKFAKVSLSTPNLVASSRDFAAFPLIPFGPDGTLSFKIRVTDSDRWIVHVTYREHTVEIRGQWPMLEDF